MKKIHFFQIIILSVIVFVSAGCKKESPATGSGITSVTINLPPPNRPPVANAGFDFTGKLYINEMTLSGAAYDPDIGDTITTTWTKITGPACSIISSQVITVLNPQQRIVYVTTLVTNLLMGEYKFELLVRDNRGAIHRDTVAVKINSIEPISSPVNLYNLRLDDGFSYVVGIDDIYPYIPSNRPIRIFLMERLEAVWHEAVPYSQYPLGNTRYYYAIINNTIYLSSDNPSPNTDVKIVF